MYDNELTRKLVKDLYAVVRKHIKNMDDIADGSMSKMSGGVMSGGVMSGGVVLGDDVPDVSPMDVVGSAMKALKMKAGKKYKKGKEMGCGISGGVMSGGMSGFAKGSFRDTGFGEVEGAAKKKVGRPKKMGSGFISETLGAFGLGKKKKMTGGMMAEKSREDEKLAMEVKGVKDAVKRKVGGRMLVDQSQLPGSDMSGMGKKKRVNKRAVIVKKVMKDMGLSMIDASRYVKANGLY